MTRESVDNRPWDSSYRIAVEAKPSWTKHGMPYLADEFMGLVKNSETPDGIHLDIGCGNGIKTINFALAGLRTLGIDRSDDCFRDGWQQIKEMGVSKECKLVKGSAFALPVRTNSVRSASDILCFTHIQPEYYGQYKAEAQRVLKVGGYLLMVLFSHLDDHFHGHPVSEHYTFHYDPDNKLMEGYSHYEGMFNTHFNEKMIRGIFNRGLSIVKMTEIQHPVYEYRKLWNLILRNT